MEILWVSAIGALMFGSWKPIHGHGAIPNALMGAITGYAVGKFVDTHRYNAYDSQWQLNQPQHLGPIAVPYSNGAQYPM
jgi:hypothetical protein